MKLKNRQANYHTTTKAT